MFLDYSSGTIFYGTEQELQELKDRMKMYIPNSDSLKFEYIDKNRMKVTVQE